MTQILGPFFAALGRDVASALEEQGAEELFPCSPVPLLFCSPCSHDPTLG
jgi:hypothetical protein